MTTVRGGFAHRGVPLIVTTFAVAAVAVLLLSGVPSTPGAAPSGLRPAPHRGSSVPPSGAALLSEALQSLAPVTPASPVSPWVNLTPFLNRSPSPREGSQVAYNPNDGHVMMFGGLARNRTLGDTWEFFAGHWVDLTPTITTNPPARYKGGFVYDSHDNEMVLFGGNYGSGYRNDTWVWNGSDWNAVVSPTSPGPREDLLLVDDASDGYVLLFGGEATNGVLGKDTWIFANNTWTNITATVGVSPPGREAGEAAYDTVDQEIVLFSGKFGTAGLAKDTWTYHAGIWTNLTASLTVVPPARESGMMAYDPIDRIVLMIGGFKFPNTLADEWRFTGNRWTLLTPSAAPTPRLDGAMGYYPNAGLGFILLFGGRTSPTANTTILGDTWSYKPPINVTLTADASTVDVGESVNLSMSVSGGYPAYPSIGWLGLPSGCTDALNASNVTCTPPIGSYNITGWSVDSGGFNGTSYPLHLIVNADPTVAITNTSLTGTAPWSVQFDALPSLGTPPYALNWSFGDGAHDSTPSTSHVYSAGWFNATVTVGDSRGISATQTAGPIHVLLGPAPLSANLTALPVSGIVPLTVQFGVIPFGGTAPYTIAWNFGFGGGTSAAAAPVFTYTNAGSYAASVTVNDSAGGTITKSVAIDVAAAVPLTAMAGAVPTSGIAPLTVQFSASASGGTAPYQYLWALGVASDTAMGPAPGYIYVAPGNYTARLTVTDSDFSIATATVNVQVLAPLGASFSSTVGSTYCSAGAALALVTLTAQVTGGSGSPTYAWTIGSTPSSVANPQAAVPAGDTTVSLVVTDQSGNTNSSSQIITVPSTSCAAPNEGAAAPMDWLLIALIVVVGAVIGVELVLLLRRKK